MNWLNLETKILHAPEYIGSDPKARATWLNVLLWAATQERGGREVDAKSWGDRQWQQTCGVTRREVMASAPLLTFDGNDLVVWNYPILKELEIKHKRELGRLGGIKSGEARTKLSFDSASSLASSKNEAELEGSLERKEKGKELELEGEVEGEGADVEKPSAQPQLSDTDWLRSLAGSPAYAGVDVAREHAKMSTWCETNRKQATRRRFVNWLNRIEKPLGPAGGIENRFNKF